MKRTLKIKMIGIGAVVLLILALTPSVVGDPVDPPKVLKPFLWYPPYGFLIPIDINGDDQADFYIDMWSNIYIDVDGDEIMDIKILPDGTIIILTPGTEPPELVWSDNELFWGLDLDGDGLIDIWKYIGGPGVTVYVYPPDGGPPHRYFVVPCIPWPNVYIWRVWPFLPVHPSIISPMSLPLPLEDEPLNPPY